MDIDLFYKPATVLIGAYGAGKVYFDMSSGKLSRMREQYRFAKEYFTDKASGEADHPFLREKGLQGIIGDDSLVADDIEYLLRLKEPAKAIKYYGLGRQYLQLSLTNSGGAIEFRPRYKNAWPRFWRKWTYFGLYGLCAFLGYAPIAFSKQLFPSPHGVLAASALTIPVGSIYAWMALKAATRVSRAEALCRSQALAEPVSTVQTLITDL
ncbi:hypothetical protein [Paraburkholderia nodosa]|uniref:hypothetical protein n=1 Tax=Paraburkholderia nodosa TaxID=392320 RepID=UPI0012B690B5|nr:hypothetical protein [Paraburkholderia nodosa]